MFILVRMPRIMGLQTELLMDQLTVKPEVRRLVDDADRFSKSIEHLSKQIPELHAERREAIAQITEWLDKEHGRLMSDLEVQGPQARQIVLESRRALTEGSELVKAMDAFYARMTAEKIRTHAPHLDYVKTFETASDAATQFRELVEMMDAFVAGGKAGVKPAALSKALNEINAQSTTVLNHIFLLAAGLIFLFFLALVLSLLCYRYLATRFVRQPRHPPA